MERGVCGGALCAGDIAMSRTHRQACPYNTPHMAHGTYLMSRHSLENIFKPSLSMEPSSLRSTPTTSLRLTVTAGLPLRVGFGLHVRMFFWQLSL